MLWRKSLQSFIKIYLFLSCKILLTFCVNNIINMHKNIILRSNNIQIRYIHVSFYLRDLNLDISMLLLHNMHKSRFNNMHKKFPSSCLRDLNLNISLYHLLSNRKLWCCLHSIKYFRHTPKVQTYSTWWMLKLEKQFFNFFYNVCSAF